MAAIRSAEFCIYAIQYFDGQEWHIGETEDSTPLVTKSHPEAIEVCRVCQEAAPNNRWRICSYLASGYSEERSIGGVQQLGYVDE